MTNGSLMSSTHKAVVVQIYFIFVAFCSCSGCCGCVLLCSGDVCFKLA